MAMMAFRSPTRYVQGPGIRAVLGQYVAPLRGTAIVALSARRIAVHGPALRTALASAGLGVEFCELPSRCTTATIEHLRQVAQERTARVIVAVGGGSISDTSKAAADRLGIDVVVVPTIAATDAPTAAAAVIYADSGGVKSIELYERAPYAVVVDTEIIAASPRRYLVSGMGDALATPYEARATRASGGTTVAGGLPTRAALGIAEACLEALLTHGPSVASGPLVAGSEALESIVEANVLLSGLGFESGGLAGAHAIHNGLVEIGCGATHLHGEIVAFSTLVHLALLGADDDLRQATQFCSTVGLPTRLAELDLPDDEPRLRVAAERACAPQDSMRNMPIEVTPDMVLDAVRAVESVRVSR